MSPPEKCEAMFCRGPVELTVTDQAGTKAGLCLEHWFEHCDDKPIPLTGGRTLVPVQMRYPVGTAVLDGGVLQ